MTTSMRATTDADAFTLPSTHAELQADAREIATQFAPRAREIRQHLLDHGEMHPELWGTLCARGWPGLVLPVQYGGAEGGLLGMTVVVEAFAEQNIVLWMPVLSAAIGHAISQAGPDSARDTWLPLIASGQALLAMATTEAHAGHSLFRSATEIRRDKDHF